MFIVAYFVMIIVFVVFTPIYFCSLLFSKKLRNEYLELIRRPLGPTNYNDEKYVKHAANARLRKRLKKRRRSS